MKSLVIYSSRTGNTKKVAGAIYDALPGEKTLAQTDRPPEDLGSYDLVFVGFWAWRRGADPMAQKVLGALKGQKVAVFGTCGAWPDSDAAKTYASNAAALLDESNTFLGSFMCQGRVNSFHQRKLHPDRESAHPMTEDRRARLEEAERHPDDADLARAAAWAKDIIRSASEGKVLP